MVNEVFIESGVQAGVLSGPFYFESSAERHLFGWLHQAPHDTPASVGIIVCNPFGYEAICAHRSARLLADSTAALGIPTIRFEYAGTGNSTDLDAEEEQLSAWTRDIVAAAAELRRTAGVEHICLIGFRLGAALAVLASRFDPSINAIIAIAPVLSGRKYLRELRTTRLAAMLGAESSDQQSEHQETRSPDDGSRDDGSLEVSGFYLAASTLRALPTLDLLDGAHSPPGKLLVIDDASVPFSANWVDVAASGGTNASYEKIPGILAILMTAPQFSTTPPALLQSIGKWLRKHFDIRSSPPNAATMQQPLAGRDEIPQIELKDPQTHAHLTEQATSFGADSRLFGIVTLPAATERRRRAVVLLNAGADYHIGPNRMYVSLARRWALRGYTVMRLDFAGIGDSDTRPGRASDEVFPPAAIGDIREAITLLRSNFGIGDVTLVGLCSGAYHALRAAVAALPVSRVVLINPQNYFWKEGMTVNDMQPGELVRNPRMYRSRLFSIESWKRLFTGKVDVSYITKILGNRLFLALESSVREAARRIRIRFPNDLGWELESVTTRGVRVVFVFARDEPGIQLLHLQAGSAVTRIGDRCRIHILDNGDHVFSKIGPRLHMQNILDAELFAAAD
jgi:pimeloyl-ACP methyl ester carboxylesterase